MRVRLGALGLGTLAAVGLIALQPTLGTLGYASALLASPFCALLGIRVGLRQLPRQDGPRPELGDLARAGLARIALVLLAALAILCASSYAAGSIDLGFGLASFALGPGFAAVCGWVCGLFGGAASARRSLRWPVAFAPPLGCLALALRRLYADPAVFAYDPFFGQFSGGVYDLDVEIGAAYLLHRVYVALAASAALLLFALAFDPARGRLSWRRWSTSARESRGRALAALFLLAASAWLGTQPARHRFHQDAANLRRILSASRSTEHFVLRFRPGSAHAREVEAIAREHEFLWHEQRALLGRAPSRRIEVFLFDSAEDKRELLGVGEAELAAPWRAQLYLQHAPWPHPVLAHELAHLFGAAFGDPLLGIALRFPRLAVGLVEGFAEAVAPSGQGALGPHERAAILDRLELRPPLATLVGPGFWGQAPARAYTAAGSFCLWIAERHGYAALCELYASAGDFEAVFSEPLAALEQRWLEFLRALPLAADDLERERLRFERGSLFERPHAYPVARLQRRIARALRAGEPERALRLQRRIVALEPAPPEHRLALARLLALAGETPEAGALLAALAREEGLARELRSVAFELEGDLALSSELAEDARASYARASELALADAHRRRIALKLHAARQPELLGPWLRYLALFPSEQDPDALTRARLAAALELGEHASERALACYLAALQHLGLQDPRSAAPLLAECRAALSRDEDWPHPDFARAALAHELTAAALLGDHAHAQHLLATSIARERGPGDRLTNELWARRLAFLRAQSPASPSR